MLCSCVRFGNVLGSRGSVIPAMVKGIKERGEVWISDEGVTRFAMPIPEAAGLVLDAVEMTSGGEIFVLKMKGFSLGQLLSVFKGMNLRDGGFDVDVRGLIRAEKLHEDLVTSDEIARLYETDSHYVVAPPVGNWSPASNMQKVDLSEYNSSHADMFADSELVEHIRECIVMLGLE